MSPRLPLDPAGVRRALFVRLRRFGDTLILAPAIRAFKAWAPDARLAVVVQPGYDEFLQLLPDVDEILIAGRGAGGLRALAAVRSWRPDLTVDFHGNVRAALLTAASGAPVKVGEARFHWPVYDVRVPRAELLFGLERPAHSIENHLALLAAVGVPTPAVDVRLPVPEAGRAALDERLDAGGVPRGLRVVLFPTTTLRGKQWPIERWLALARRLAVGWEGALVVPLAAEDSALAERVRREAGGAHVLTGLALAELAALVAGSALVVTHDSMGAHLAAACGVPSVVLYGATDPALYHPWRAPFVALRAEGLCCSPCGGRTCRSPYFPWACIDGLDDEVVLSTVRAHLAAPAT